MLHGILFLKHGFSVKVAVVVRQNPTRASKRRKKLAGDSLNVTESVRWLWRLIQYLQKFMLKCLNVQLWSLFN